jgi:hypothetical protein
MILRECIGVELGRDSRFEHLEAAGAIRQPLILAASALSGRTDTVLE